MRKSALNLILFALAMIALTLAATAPAFAGIKEAFTDLYYQIQNEDWDGLKKSLAKPNPTLVNYNNGELLQGALGMVKDPKIIKMLLNAGANPNLLQKNTDNNGLHIVLAECKDYNYAKVLAITKLLVAKNCNVNHKRNSDGYTPIHMAVRNEEIGKDILAVMLAAKNLDVNVCCNPINECEDGAWPALFYAVQRANDPTKSNKDIVKMLVDKGANLNFLTSDASQCRRKKWNVLHILCETSTDRDDMAQILVDAGMGVDTPTPDTAMTPLHLALMSNNPKICRYLLEKGADIKAKNSDGVDILAHAKGYCSDKHYDSAKVVIDWANTH